MTLQKKYYLFMACAVAILPLYLGISSTLTAAQEECLPQFCVTKVLDGQKFELKDEAYDAYRILEDIEAPLETMKLESEFLNDGSSYLINLEGGYENVNALLLKYNMTASDIQVGSGIDWVSVYAFISQEQLANFLNENTAESLSKDSISLAAVESYSINSGVLVERAPFVKPAEQDGIAEKYSDFKEDRLSEIVSTKEGVRNLGNVSEAAAANFDIDERLDTGLGRYPLGGCPCPTAWLDWPGVSGFQTPIANFRENLESVLQWAEGYNNLDLRLVRPSGTTTSATTTGAHAMETLKIANPPGGTWTLKYRIQSIHATLDESPGVSGLAWINAYEFGGTIDSVWSYREHKHYSQYTPDFIYTEEPFGTQRVDIHDQGTTSIGYSYFFKVFNKADILGKDIKVTWQHNRNGPGTGNVWLEVLDGLYEKESPLDFPNGSPRITKGGGILGQLPGTPAGGWAEKVDTLSAASINYAASTQSQVAVFVTMNDPHFSTNYTLYIKQLQIVGLATWTFQDPIVVNTVTGTSGDYGIYSASSLGS